MWKTFVGLAFIALSGCTYMPISSMLKLRQFDLMTADARQIRVAVQMPEAIGVREGGAVLEIGVERSSSGEKLEERFMLEQVPGTGAAPGVERMPGSHLEVFRMSEADMERLSALRRTVGAWKAVDPDGTKGSLSIGAAGCRRGVLPEGALPVSTYLRTGSEEEFITMTRDMDLRTLVTDSDENIGLPPCESRP